MISETSIHLRGSTVLVQTEIFCDTTGAARPRGRAWKWVKDMFYRRGVWRGEKVFARDAQGRVVTLLDRRENNDLVWRKVK